MPPKDVRMVSNHLVKPENTLQPSLFAARNVPVKRAVASGVERGQTAVFTGYILSSLVPKPIRAKRVSRGGLEPTAIAQGLAKKAKKSLVGEKKLR